MTDRNPVLCLSKITRLGCDICSFLWQKLFVLRVYGYLFCLYIQDMLLCVCLGNDAV